MPIHRLVASVVLLTAILVGGCSRQKPAAAPPSPPKVTVVRPATAQVTDYWEYNGSLDSIESVEIRARVRGLLTRRHFVEGQDVKGTWKWINGDVIAAGDLLYQIDKREYLTAQAKATAELAKAEAEIEKSQADIKNWEAQIQLATADFTRVDDAVKKGVGSKTDLDKAKATVDVNKAQLAAAKAAHLASIAARDSAASALHTTEIQLGYTDIRAPISGQIGRTVVTEGNLVGQSEPTHLTTIVRVDELYVYFDVPEQDLMEYLRDAERLGLPTPPDETIPVWVRVPGQSMPWYPGRINYVEGHVNSGTGTVRVRGVIPNPLRPGTDVRLFVPGLFVHVRVQRSPARPRLSIPEDAIMTGQEGRFVFVVGEKGVVEKRIVTVGSTVWKAPATAPGEVVPGWALVNPKPVTPPTGPPPPTRRPILSVVAITENLKAEDRVIVEGVQRARPGSPVMPEEWEMHPPAAPPKQ